MALRDRFPRIGNWLGRASEIASNVLIGSRDSNAPILSGASRTFLVSIYRKLIAAVIGGAIAWLHTTLGWDLVSFFGDGFELGLIEVVTAWLVYRLPNAVPAAR